MGDPPNGHSGIERYDLCDRSCDEFGTLLSYPGPLNWTQVSLCNAPESLRFRADVPMDDAGDVRGVGEDAHRTGGTHEKRGVNAGILCRQIAMLRLYNPNQY